jgi:acetamidase/formamidase
MIHARPENLHGHFSRDLPPIATVASGTTVELATLDAWWGLEPFSAEYGPRDSLEHPGAREGHALTGPIAVEGLLPDEVLEIEFLALEVADRGFTEAGGFPSPHYERLHCHAGGPRMLLWKLDRSSNTASSPRLPHLTVPLNPFLGVVGLAPSRPGKLSTTPPRRTGGNLDCSLLTVGSRLLLPVEVAGGLLSVGDAHAAQGDGELSNNGIECAMPLVQLRLTRRADFRLTGPLVIRDDLTAALGLGPSLDDAMYDAANRMLDHLIQELHLSRVEALGYMSVAVDFRITQVVNGIKGVHAIWKHAPQPSAQ